MSQSLIAFDTDHIKHYVFGTNKLKEIRGASSILDRLNREETVKIAKEDFGAHYIYANGGSALFIINSTETKSAEQRAEELGQKIKRLYHKWTSGGASITYAIQPIPENNKPNIMTASKLNENVAMVDVLKLLRLRLRMAKDSLQMDMSPLIEIQQDEALTHITLPTHALLCTCESCGNAYAQTIDDADGTDDRYCRMCMGKRDEDVAVKRMLDKAHIKPVPETRLWGRISNLLTHYGYDLSSQPDRPDDFNVFREFTHGKEYLGLIYADANSIGKALEDLETLQELKEFADRVDKAVFKAMAHAITNYLPVQGQTFPFDILLIGGDDIIMVTPADKAMQIARTLAEEFHKKTENKYTLSIGVVLAPVTYPFSLQYELVDETIKAAKKSGAKQQAGSTESLEKREQSRINFVVVTGNTSLDYQHQYNEMHRKATTTPSNEFFATLRPYTLSQFDWLLEQLKKGNEKRLGRTKLHQLREAILKLNQTTTILESLALLRNWKKEERDFMKAMAQEFDVRQTKQQHDMGSLFPWYLDGKASNEKQAIYRTPLLDFIELYDFVSS